MTPKEYDEAAWLHVYAQDSEHRPAEIRGTKSALIALRDAIDAALAHPNGEAGSEAFAADGEGYSVEIRRVPRASLMNSRLPYYYKMARR